MIVGFNDFIKMCWQKIVTGIKKYYSIEYDKNKIIDLFIFFVSVVFIGFLIFLLTEFSKIILFNNFSNEVISIMGLIVILSFVLLFTIFIIIENKHKGILPYIIMIILFLLYFYLLPFTSLIKILIIIFIVIILFPVIWERWGRLNLWTLLSIFLVLILLLVGFSFLQSTYGYSRIPIKPILCNGSENNDINMICSSNKNGELISDYLTTCNFNKTFKNLSGDVQFELFNGSKSKSSFNTTIQFVPPSGLRNIIFKINATTNKNITICMDNELNETLNFYSYEDLQRRKEKFNDLLITLFGVVLISVPAIVINLRKIWRE